MIVVVGGKAKNEARQGRRRPPERAGPAADRCSKLVPSGAGWVTAEAVSSLAEIDKALVVATFRIRDAGDWHVDREHLTCRAWTTSTS